jgi:hypothetical protein
MKIVKENINFERGQDPKGSMEIGLLKAIEQKGVRISVSRGDPEDERKEKEKLKNNAKSMYEVVNLLIESGIDPSKIYISGEHTINIPVYRVISGGMHVIIEVLSHEDGEMLVKVIESLAIAARMKVSNNTDSKLIYDYEVSDWLKNLKENREKYKNLL